MTTSQVLSAAGCVLCRLAKGMDLSKLCRAFNAKLHQLPTSAEANELKAWWWHFSIRIMHKLAEVSLAA